MRKWEEEESLGAYLELNPGPPDLKEGMLTITPWMKICYILKILSLKLAFWYKSMYARHIQRIKNPDGKFF